MREMSLPAHWEMLPFTGCLKTIKSKKVSSIQKNDYQQSAEFPVIDQGAAFISGWTDSTESVIFDNLPVVIFGDHTRIFKYVDFPFAMGADGTKILYANDDVLDARFFYFALMNLKVPDKGYNRHYKYLREFSVVCPPLPEQRAIAHVLQTIQEAKAARQREIDLERERKASLMDYLFSRGTKGESRKQTIIGETPKRWKILSFEGCLEKVKSVKIPSIPKKEYQEHGIFPVIDQGATFISGWTDTIELVIFDNLPVVIFGDHTRIFKYVDFSFAMGADGTKLLYPKEDILDTRFFYYALLNLKIPDKGYNRHYKYLRELSIPCPSLPEQRVIAHVLQTADEKITALEQEAARLDELFHAMLDELMTGKRSAVPLIHTEISN